MDRFQSGDPNAPARRILEVPTDATPDQIEAAYLKRVVELRVAFLDLGGFSKDPCQQNLRFENFVVGDSNSEAVRLARKVSSGPTNSCNPLYLFGKTGLGKTHLLNAIANEASARRRRLVHLCSAQTFMEEMIQLTARGRLHEFREKYRQLDYLLMDDVQMLAGKNRTQDEAYYIVNQLIGRGSQVVLAGRPSREGLEHLGSGLRSRIAQSVAVEIGYPELGERQDIVSIKAREMTIDLPRCLVYYLATQYSSDVRELEAAVRRIHTHISEGGTVDNVAEAEAVLFGRVPQQGDRKVSLEDIQEMVGRHFNLQLKDLRKATGSLKIKRARQIAMYLAKELCGCTLDEVRQAFKAEPSQVMYAQRKVKTHLSDPMIAEDLRAITKALAEA